MFTIEDLIEKIYEPKTKDLFRDVYTSYTQGQYRATVVMLWTVVVCDFIYKLQYLRDVYNDSVAISILNDVAQKQTNDPKNPAWETSLIEQVKVRTKFIDQIEKEALDDLQKNRNLCAHPIITSDNILYKPSKEKVRALIRTALEAILLKSPLLSREYISIILEDFAKRGDNFILEEENFQKYFHNRYLKHLNTNQILNFFKLLWRMVFSPHDDIEKNNIYINAQLLEYIFTHYKTDCVNYMKKNIDYYTYDTSIGEAKYQFNSFLLRHKDTYSILSETTKAVFASEKGYFPDNIPHILITENNFNKSIETIYKDFTNRREAILDDKIIVYSLTIKNQAKEHNCIDEYFDFCIECYANSCSYDEADLFFNAFIRFNCKDFEKEKILKFVESTSTNSQTYNRIRAEADHKIIMKRYMELDGTYSELNGYRDWQNLFLELGGTPF